MKEHLSWDLFENLKHLKEHTKTWIKDNKQVFIFFKVEMQQTTITVNNIVNVFSTGKEDFSKVHIMVLWGNAFFFLLLLFLVFEFITLRPSNRISEAKNEWKKRKTPNFGR